jgi:hypothetical protein
MARNSKPHPKQSSQDQTEQNGSNGTLPAPTVQGPFAPNAFVWEYYPTPDDLTRLSSTLDALIENFERIRQRAKLWGDDLSAHTTSEAFRMSYRGFKEFCECLGLYGRRFDPQTMSCISSTRMPGDLFIDMFGLAHSLSYRDVIGHFNPPGLVPLVTDPTLAMLRDAASRLRELIKGVEPAANALNRGADRWTPPGYLGLQVDEAKRRVQRKGTTPVVEFQGNKLIFMLFCKLLDKGEALTSPEELRRVWDSLGGSHLPELSTIRDAVSELRGLLKPLSVGVKTTRTAGYELEDLTPPDDSHG